MDVVRLFLNNDDIEPSAVLVHFLRFLGFYVEQNESSRSYVGDESVLDIYIVSNDFFTLHKDTLNNVNLEKTILILKDEWYSEDDMIKSLHWDENDTNEMFLTEFVQLIYEQIEESGKAQLLKSDVNWKENAINVVREYTRHKLLESSLVTRCFYKQNEFYNWGINNYIQFIENFSNSNMSDYTRYVLLLAKYEADLISKKNSYKYYFNPDILLEECNELLNRYNENEELHLLRADILFELQGNWWEGCDGYGDEEVSHCAYSFLKRGKIVRKYYGEYENINYLFNKSVEIFPEYYQVWYQLGDFYEANGDVSEAIKAFKRVYKILENKFKRQILAPVEWEYIYKAIMRIAIIYKLRIGDYTTAYGYNDIANKIRDEHAIDYYIERMLGDGLNISNIRDKIYEAIKEHVDIKLEEIY